MIAIKNVSEHIAYMTKAIEESKTWSYLRSMPHNWKWRLNLGKFYDIEVVLRNHIVTTLLYLFIIGYFKAKVGNQTYEYRWED